MSDLEFQVTLSNISKTAEKISLRLDRLNKLIDALSKQDQLREKTRMELQVILNQQSQHETAPVKY